MFLVSSRESSGVDQQWFLNFPVVPNRYRWFIAQFGLLIRRIKSLICIRSSSRVVAPSLLFRYSFIQSWKRPNCRWVLRRCLLWLRLFLNIVQSNINHNRWRLVATNESWCECHGRRYYTYKRRMIYLPRIGGTFHLILRLNISDDIC